MPTVPATEILWNFHIFSKFNKFHKLTEFTGIIIWNMHKKFELIRRSWKFSWKNADSGGYRNIMKIPYLFKAHQISSNLQNLLES